MIVAGIKLPGLEFRNQRVEAAFRKELVLGEDDEKRAEPETLKNYLLTLEEITFVFTFTTHTLTYSGTFISN